MGLFEKLRNKELKAEATSVRDIQLINKLPQLEVEPLTLASKLSTLAANGPVCNYTLWQPVEKNVIFTVEIPLGFKRDTTVPFETFVSIDQTYLYVYDQEELKPAQVQLLDDQGQVVTMTCSIEVLKKLMTGELIFNVITKGFKTIDFLDGTMTRGGINTEQTAFAHEQQVLYDETLGYTCKACQTKSTQDLSIAIQMGTPFIMLPDGTKVEETTVTTLGIGTPTFDELLDGKTNLTINMPCKIVATYVIDPIS